MTFEFTREERADAIDALYSAQTSVDEAEEVAEKLRDLLEEAHNALQDAPDAMMAAEWVLNGANSLCEAIQRLRDDLYEAMTDLEAKVREEAEVEEEDAPHDQLTLAFPGSPDLTGTGKCR